MVGAYVISALLIFYGIIAQCTDVMQDTMPVQEFSANNDGINHSTRESKLLKAYTAALKVISEMQQSSSMNEGSSPYLDLQPGIPSNCAEALMRTQQNGIYTVKVRNYGPPFQVYCDANTFGGNWTVLQRRQDGSVDFYRNWTEYKQGFGDLNGEFFIGLDKLYALTAESPQELLIELEDFDNEVRYARYNSFAIGAEDEDFALSTLGSYSGNANDSLTHHKGMKFTTKDRKNDITTASINCAQSGMGAWWYRSCHVSNLNGLYLKGEHQQYEKGVEWHYWKGAYYSLKRVQMLLRPKNP